MHTTPFNPALIKGIIFDYGGTIDSNGMHWAEVIWMAYEHCRVPVSKETFRTAYVHGERTLGKTLLILPQHTFHDMLRIKMTIQLEWLQANGHLSEAQTGNGGLSNRLAAWCYAYARQAIDNARPILEQLHARYPMVLVSNFYGNIEAVLKDFGLDHLFGSIVESAVVGIRKPDPRIFSLGVDELGVDAAAIVVIGDSHDKDILPAASLGCRTVWLKSLGWTPYRGTESADAIITDFRELAEVFRLS